MGVRAGDAEKPADARARGGARPRQKTSFVGVLGEVLITAGVLVLLYVVWQLWVGDWIFAAQRNAEGHTLSQQWQQQYEDGLLPTHSPTPNPSASADPGFVEPPILAPPGDAEIFGTMLIPRFGADYAVNIAGGVSRANTLDKIGIGHYPGAPMPGEVGNFALAAHRTTWGKPFNRIAELRVGDAIVVETPEGWYTYRFRTLQYVTPDQVDVLLPVPQMPSVPAGERYLTMTSCSPFFSMAERIVGYSVFDSFTPRSDGPPASLTDGVAA